MNQPKSHFRSELAIIPPVAKVIAVLAFALMQICLLGLLPHYEKRHTPDAVFGADQHMSVASSWASLS